MPYTKRAAVALIKKNRKILLNHLNNLQNGDIAIERRILESVRTQLIVDNKNL